jgi:nucleoside-diphosphate-sugar epimerase
MSWSWLIIGCGYTGTRLARALAAQPEVAAEVTITRRDRAAARALAESIGEARSRGGEPPVGSIGVRGVRGERADLADPGSLEVAPGTVVVCLAPPGPDPAGEISALLAAGRGAARIVYVSSTGVYGPGGGAWVDETWPIAPITESGRARAVAEAALAEAAVPWVALRAAGIYGPGRGLTERLRAGTYRVIGDGTSHVSRIHVVDLVTAIIRAGTTQITGAINAADDDPAPIGEVADAIAARLGVPAPPRVPGDQVPLEVAGMLTADRRIANRRLRDELGVVLRYPSWRDALDHELAGARGD